MKLPLNQKDRAAFLAAFSRAADEIQPLGYSGDFAFDYAHDKESFDCDMANALSEACAACGLPDDVETAGDLYDVLADEGWLWNGEA